MTNENIIRGKVKQVEGKIQDAYGDLANDPEADIKGKIKQVEGKIQEGVGHAQKSADDTAREEDRAAIGRP
jgi:uncharacterized protein YjbJ (UPF0337 family)